MNLFSVTPSSIVKKSILIIFTLLIVSKSIMAAELSDYVDTSKCDQIIDKQLYQICYSYKYKGALSGWVMLDGVLVGKGNIKKRPRFYNEKTISMKYRTKYKDYTGYGEQWNRGHFIVADADFDYDAKALNKAYTMANIQPQSANLNQRTWIKVERYGRSLAAKLGYINSISIANYNGAHQTVGNNIVIPTGFYRIYYNNDVSFEKCFYYENNLNIDIDRDKLKDHEINCKSAKL